MADIRLQLDEVQLCVNNMQLMLPGVRRDSTGQLVDHVDIVLPWGVQQALRQLANFGGMNYGSLHERADG